MQYDPEDIEPPEGFDWDPAKNESNTKKHGVTFSEATHVFEDMRHYDVDNTRREFDEERRKAVGRVGTRLIAVIYTIRGDQLRIISARLVGPDERREYRQGQI